MIVNSFTGLAGTGKSQILLAIGRLLSRSGTFCVEGHIDIPLVPSWMMTLAKGDGLNQLLGHFVDPHGTESPEGKDRRIPELLNAAARVSWRSGTCVMPVDEFQWIAASSTANARASTVLLKLHGIGPLLLYCANFSLIHKLKNRPAEDRDRLLSRPIVLQPLAAQDADWIAYLAAVRGVAPDLLIFDPSADAKSIHNYSFGIKRKVVDLVEIAVESRKSASATVGINELLAAYQSTAYTLHREDVEALHRQTITGKVERDDLTCPFKSTAAEARNVEVVQEAIESFEKRTEDAILADAMLPTEAAAHRTIAKESSPAPKEGKVVRFRPGKVTKESLLAGAATLDAFD